MMNLDNIAIRHDQQHQMFFIKLNGGAAHLKYNKPKEDVWDIKETYVPESARSIGLVGLLVKHTLERANSQNKSVILSCPFAEGFIEKNPEYKDLLR